MKGLQIIKWFPEWQGVHFLRFKKSDMRFIYDWCLYLGFWEIRKWHTLKPGELKRELKGGEYDRDS